MKYSLLFILLALSTQALSSACLVESNDAAVPIRMCQQNISIPPHLFTDSFCQPQIPERSFTITLMEQCPTGAYGICDGAQNEGVAYRQAIHYYSEAADAPVLQAYCEQISNGTWRTE